ncbi:MAG: hypothetical protein JSS65_05100 [Armatimonadetes bacterium]|nr:hypothetical protein [Armatimonadota bacterium]
MKKQRGWGFAVSVGIAILLLCTAGGFAYGFKDGLANPDKYDWTYLGDTGLASEITGGIKIGTYGLLAGLVLTVLYFIVFAQAKKKGGGPVAVGQALTDVVEAAEEVNA